MSNNGNNHDEVFEPAKFAPHSQDAEEAVLGSILINPEAYLDVAGFLRPDDFFLLHNSWIWEAMQRLDGRSDPVEYLTVIEELRTQERLDEVGGAAYITYIASNIGTSVHAGAYGRIVERAAIRRRMLEAASEITRLAREEGADVHTVWEEGRQAYDKSLPTSYKTTGLRHIRDSASDLFDVVTSLYENPDQPIGVASGFIDLDKLIGGFHKSDLYILAGRPKMGKTALLKDLLISATKAKHRGALFSLEQSELQIVSRIVSSETSINLQKFRLGGFTEWEYKQVVDMAGKLSDWNLFVDDTPAQTVMQIRAKCFHLKSRGCLDIVFLDYLQKIGAGGRFEQRSEAVRQMVEDLKNMARELEVPVVAAAQLSRAVEQRTDKRPNLSDLAESGNIEKEADVIMLLYRDEYYNEATERPNEADVIVAGNRHGPTGTAQLYFRKQFTQFTNLKKTEINLETIIRTDKEKRGYR